MNTSPTLSVAVAVNLAPWLSGCTVHEPELDRSPIVEVTGAYRERPDGDMAAELEAPWWTRFDDPELDAIVEVALEANLDVRALAARIEAADALVRQAGGRLLPRLDATADYSFTFESSSDTTDLAAVGLDLSWELDVWGRLRSAKRATELDAVAARWDWVGGRLLLSASAVETYFEILEQLEQLELLNEQIEVNDTLLELTRLRFGQGQSSVVAVLQQREQLASTRALIPVVEARLEQLEYVLDVLLGQVPGARQRLEPRPLASPPPFPAIGVPADLLQERPDLIAARDRVNALDYRVGEAIADRLPRLQVGGSVAGVGDPGIDTLVSSLIAGAVAPVYDAGILRAEVDLRSAELEEAIADYSQTFLVAVQEVETAMIQERKQAEQVTRLEEQLSIAQQLLTETRNRYSQGLTDYLPVLAALVTVQNLERELITSRRRYLSFRVALHRAIGGPMSPSTPTPATPRTMQPVAGT